ncbi:NAD-dependent DNA ligase LigA [Blattabacterium sp. (Blaberus giganteus)]|uniref:NAD-dependent DNA ligase LigA n=1 Tax=Blattabacterium sp. (Blaberus giganteus) TaxID=1186051 RepID=UPI00025F6F37|nr:NAD-dependent DNA ligase LigA [Blattabacterium sp. (Blaberus giganteus)]AFJ90748.1 DNA ligase [Blattabacterium sp. (Blaberus giganteus)]
MDKDKIYKLRKELLKYNDQYYNFDNSEISDLHFDKKLKKLSFLEKKYPELYDPTSPTIKIGAEVHERNFISSVYHKYKMYSIQNTYSKKELMIWKTKISKSVHSLSFVCEPKYDGVSINLIYKNGFLINAVTRGDGEKGEDVTKNIKTIKYIPFELSGKNHPPYLEIRGEIFLPIKNFIEINKKRIKNGHKPYANPRNTASGTLKIHDTQEVRKRNLFCIAFHVVGNNLPFDTQYEAIKYIKYWGFKTPETTRFCRNMKEVYHFIDFWNIYQNKRPYHTDGIVIKVNEHKKQSILGFTNKYPRWAIAYKFRQKSYETKLLNITFQVGRTGIITPVANVIPILIDGTTIKRVALYNDNFIQKMGIHYDDALLLEKGGNIIPKVTEINIKKRSNQTFPVFFLKKCPSCNNILTKKNELFYCINQNCFSQRIKKIIHFVNVMNIKKIGSKMINKLYEKGFLYNFYDLYELRKEELLQIEGIKEKLACSILNNIEKSKKNPYCRVLFSLGIRYVGEYISKKLTENFLDLNSLRHANYHHLISISGIGKRITKSIITYFSMTEHQRIVKMLIKYGLHIYKRPIMKKYSFIEGKSFVFTGKLSSMTRHEAKNIVEFLGGRVYNTVNNKINFIVVGKNFGSKLKKSMKKNHVKILTEHIFLNALQKEKKIK